MNVIVEKVYIYEVDFRNYKILAYADIVVENTLRLRAIKLLQNKLDNTTFLQMPSCKETKRPIVEIFNKNLLDNIKSQIQERIKFEYENT